MLRGGMTRRRPLHVRRYTNDRSRGRHVGNNHLVLIRLISGRPAGHGLCGQLRTHVTLMMIRTPVLLFVKEGGLRINPNFLRFIRICASEVYFQVLWLSWFLFEYILKTHMIYFHLQKKKKIMNMSFIRKYLLAFPNIKLYIELKLNESTIFPCKAISAKANFKIPMHFTKLTYNCCRLEITVDINQFHMNFRHLGWGKPM